jgi:HPr kinase/phosphorylase
MPMVRPDENLHDEIRHASTVAVGGHAVLIEGPSGSGKSTLALALMSLGADLVADDRTRVYSEGARLMAIAPPNLPEAIEARGIGLLPARLIGPVPVVLGVDLSLTETQRLPLPRHSLLCGCNIRLLHNVGSVHFPAMILQYLRGIQD